MLGAPRSMIVLRAELPGSTTHLADSFGKCFNVRNDRRVCWVKPVKTETQKSPFFSCEHRNGLHAAFVSACLNMRAKHVEHRNPARPPARLPLGEDPRILRFEVLKAHNGAPMR